jgi:hypothetical protein
MEAPPAHNPLQNDGTYLDVVEVFFLNGVIVVFFLTNNSTRTHSFAKCRQRLLSVIQLPSSAHDAAAIQSVLLQQPHVSGAATSGVSCLKRTNILFYPRRW